MANDFREKIDNLFSSGKVKAIAMGLLIGNLISLGTYLLLGTLVAQLILLAISGVIVWKLGEKNVSWD